MKSLRRELPRVNSWIICLHMTEGNGGHELERATFFAVSDSAE